MVCDLKGWVIKDIVASASVCLWDHSLRRWAAAVLGGNKQLYREDCVVRN